ncbi:MAG TPA: response regulator transcription factor [Pirellulales bacterium]|nr:response regulator transcription factor [Pirellulales bacterium]
MRVLIIEDQTDLRRVLMDMLEENGFAVDVAADGLDGLAKAMAYPYDVIVLDIMLPKLDGRRVLESLRATHGTPVLILSARDALDDRVAGLNLGADDYLTKPFDRAELLARLRALVRRSAGKAAPTVVIGDLKVDLAARTVTRGDEAIALTAREYALLEYLALHRGRVVERAELYDHLFDETDDTVSNVLDVYVSVVRKKLGPHVIETRRGLGYVIP